LLERADSALAALNDVSQPTVPISTGGEEGVVATLLAAARQHATAAPLATTAAFPFIITPFAFAAAEGSLLI
jgi:hypothetical protein